MTDSTQKILLDPVNNPERWMITRIDEKIFLEVGVETTELSLKEAQALGFQLMRISDA